MNIKELQTYYDFNYWANNKILDVVKQINPDEFVKVVAGGYGSIRNTLVHILSTEWGWLSRCGGKERGSALKPIDYQTVEEVISDWEKVEGYVREFLSKTIDAELLKVIEYPGKDGIIRSMPMGELLHHSTIHGVHHRGQVAILIRELGNTPPSIDILFYYAEQHGVKAW